MYCINFRKSGLVAIKERKSQYHPHQRQTMETNNKVYSKLDRHGDHLREEDSDDGVSYNNPMSNYRHHDREEEPSLFSPAEEALKVYGYDLTLSESMRDADPSINNKKLEVTTVATSKDASGMVTKSRRSNSHRRGALPRIDGSATPSSAGSAVTGFQKELQLAHRQFLEKKLALPSSSLDGDEEKKDDGGHSSSHRMRSRIYDLERMKLSRLSPTVPAAVSTTHTGLKSGPSSTPAIADSRARPNDDYGVHTSYSTTRQLQIELQKTCRILDLERLKNLAMAEKLLSVEAELRDCQESKSNELQLEQYALQVRQLHEEVSRQRKELENERAKRKHLQEEIDIARKNNEKCEEQLSVLTFQHIPSVAPKFKDIGSVDYNVRESFGYVGQYQIGKVLGEGFYGSVRVGTHLGSNQKYAMKILSKERITKFKDLQQVAVEVHVLKHYPHPNIIQLEEVIHAPDNIYVVTELCTMDLHKYHNDIGLTEASAKQVILGTLLPLHHLHTHGICHLDLKPENILLTQIVDMDNLRHTNVRLCDFGLVNMARKPDQSKAIVRSGYACGTPGFYAPEMVLNTQFEGREADMWSLGCILLEITLGFTKEWIECYERVESDPERFRHGIESALREVCVDRYPLHEKLIDLIHSCLSMDASKRSDSARALAHPWVNDITLSDLASCRSRADDVTQLGQNSNGGILSRLYRERESIVGDALPRFCM
jgi:serine/threonine protein kinase